MSHQRIGLRNCLGHLQTNHHHRKSSSNYHKRYNRQPAKRRRRYFLHGGKTSLIRQKSHIKQLFSQLLRHANSELIILRKLRKLVCQGQDFAKETIIARIQKITSKLLLVVFSSGNVIAVQDCGFSRTLILLPFQKVCLL